MSGHNKNSMAGSDGSDGLTGSLGGVLDEVRDWFARFVSVMDDLDLDLLTLWAAHTHLCVETYTSPRLQLDSPMPGSGKSTVLDHLSRLCLDPVQMASLSSTALLPRMLDQGLRTLLIDEADRALDPKVDGVGELLAILNSGYRRGSTRPVLVSGKGGSWDPKEMPTFAPVAMAGNAPRLPDDTRTRTIRVVLLPDLDGRVEESDWEFIEDDAKQLGRRLSEWADSVRDRVRESRPEIHPDCKGRAKERWFPLKRIAVLAGERWSNAADALIVRDMKMAELDREDGFLRRTPAVQLLFDIHEVWDPGQVFLPTVDLLSMLISVNPAMWGREAAFGRDLTAQRMGRMLAQSFQIHSERRGDHVRGYSRAGFDMAWRRMGVTSPNKPVKPSEPSEPAKTGDDTPSREPVKPSEPSEPAIGTSIGNVTSISSSEVA